jgi:uncharacterized protein (TIGR02145 family)
MQDKSSYSNPNKPQISEGLQNFINAMVEEIILQSKSFDEQKKKWLKKYSENECINYNDLEENLNDFFELIDDYMKSQSSAFKRMLSNQASTCFISNILLDKLISQQPQIVLPKEKRIITSDTQFKTVKIGSQIWMAENLNVDRFRNGDPIPEAQTDEEWQRAGKSNQPAWCYFDNVPTNGDKYGKLYNWYAVNDIRGLAPENWHVPSKNEFETLLDKFADEKNALHALLRDGSSGFNANICGYRYDNGDFRNFTYSSSFWSESFYDCCDGCAWFLNLINNFGGNAYLSNIYRQEVGCSVRCIQNN